MTLSESNHSPHPTAPAVSARAGLTLALILPVFALAPLFYPGFFQTHAGFIPLWNVQNLHQTLGRWSWLPAIALQFDPLRSDGLLPYYLAALLPLNPLVGIKLVFGAAWLLGSAGMYLWLKKWLGVPGALVSALVYTYLPYRLAVVYGRGAWGEALFWGLLPWIILAATYLVTSPKLTLVPTAAFFWLLAGLAHLGLTLWAFIFLLLLLAVVHPRQIALPALAALAGLAAAFGFYLAVSAFPAPASPVVFADHFLYPFQLFSAYWGFGPSRPGWNDGLPMQLGVAAVGLSAISLFLWQGQHPAPAARFGRRLIFFAAVTVVLALLTLGMFGALWRMPLWPGLTLAGTLNYPWQLLGLAGLCLAVLAGAALWLDARLTALPLLAGVVLLVLLSSYPYVDPQFMEIEPRYRTGPQAILGDNQVALLDHAFAVQISAHTAGLSLDQTAIPLAVYGPAQPQNTLLLTVRWQPLQPFSQNLKVFAHLVDPHNNVIVQYDGYLQEAAHPTPVWTPGEIVGDTYPLPIPADAPAGPYRVYLGLYDEATLTRLPIPTDAEGRVILDVR
jgi:hypothetical protein